MGRWGERREGKERGREREEGEEWKKRGEGEREHGSEVGLNYCDICLNFDP